MAKVEFVRIENIEDLENIDIKDGQLIYIKNGKTFMDYGTERIPTGSGGSDIVIGTEADITEDTKLFIDTAEIQNKGSEVVDTLEGNETYKAPSVRAVKECINKSALQAEPASTLTLEKGIHKVSLSEKIKVGNGFAVENGGIKVVSDKIQKVNISAQAHFESGASNATQLGLQVFKNDTLVLNISVRGGQDWTSVPLPTALLNVQKNDILYLYVGTQGAEDNFTLYTSFSSTNLYVEEF